MSLVTKRCSAAIVAATTALAATLAHGTSPASAAEPVPPAVAGLTWLADELAANDGMFTITFGTTSYPDPGLTIDAVLAELAGDRGQEPAVQTAVAAIDAATFDYVNQGSGVPAYRAANATAKALLLQQVLATDLGDSVDLEVDLRSLMAVDGDEIGRFNDTELPGYDNYANGLGQALAVLALDRTTGGVPPEAVDFLLDQQCADGSFRLYYVGYVTSYDPYETVTDLTCTDPAQGDLDATALALQALLAASSGPGDPAAVAADAAAAHLLAAQEASGGFTGTGSTNANTTGLAAQALRAAGETAAADDAAVFLNGLQLRSCTDFGAMAYDATGFAAGIDADRDQWIRATAQGVLGLGLPSYGGIGSAALVTAGLPPMACPEPPRADPSITLSASSVAAGATVSLSATGFDPAEMVDISISSTPRALAEAAADAAGALQVTVTIPADLEPGLHRIDLVGRTSGVTVSAPIEVTATPATPGRPTLPATGSPAGAETGIGLALLGLGALLLATSRRLTGRA